MEKSKFNSIILNNFNELINKYQNDVKNEWDGEEIGSTILIEDYLLPFIYEHINDQNIMNRFSKLLEELITLDDDYVEEVLYCAFFEKIHYDNVEQKFIPYYLAKTLIFYKGLKF